MTDELGFNEWQCGGCGVRFVSREVCDLHVKTCHEYARLSTSLPELAEIMAKWKLRRLSFRGVEMEMDPAGFSQAAEDSPATPAVDDDPRCACGHAVVTEHNEHGCLHGCFISLCAPEQPKAEA